MRHTRLLTCLLALTLILAACGDDSDADETADPDPTDDGAADDVDDAEDDGDDAAGDDAAGDDETDGGEDESAGGDSDLACEGLGLRIAAANPGYPRLPVYIAEYGGYFEDLGMDVRFIETDSGADAAAALIGGSVDMTAGTYSDVLLARVQGADIAAFGASGYEEISNLAIKEWVLEEAGLTPDSDPNDIVRALEGHRIGVTSPGASTDLLARAIVTIAGMDPDSDVSIVSVGASAMASAFANDQIEALVLSSPLANAAADNGEGVIGINFSAAEHPDISGALINSMIAATATAESMETELRCFLSALDRALALMKDDPEQAKELAWNEFDGVVEREEFDATIDANIGAFAEDSTLDEDGARQRQELIGIVLPEVLDLDIADTFVLTD